MRKERRTKIMTEFDRECINLVLEEYPEENLEFKRIIYADDALNIMLFKLSGKDVCFTVTHTDNLLKVAVSTADELAGFAGGEK